MEILLLFGGATAAFILSAALWRIKDIIENSVIAIVGYFCIFVIVSGLLFWMDIFQICLAEGITLGIEMLLLLLVRKHINCRSLQLEIKNNSIPIIICILMLPVIWNKFELYGMGQDEGVYQTQAISLLSGDTKLQYEIGSYNNIPEDKREEYLEAIQKKLVGFYLYDDSLPTLNSENKIGDSAGFYHGIPTFPAVLALWGSVTGMENMAGIQTLFYFCAIFLIYYIAGNLKIGRLYQNISTILFAISPIVIWVCKSTLTEMMLVCLIELFIYFLINKGTRRFILASAIPIVAFSFFHITIYTVIPAIALLYFFLYIYERKKEYLIANTIVLLAFAAGINMMAQIAATYSFTYNFLPIYQLSEFINQINVLTILTFCAAAGMVVSVVLYVCMGKSKVLLLKEKTKTYKNVQITIRVILILAVAANIAVIVNTASNIGIKDTLRFSTLVGYGLFTGMILLVCAILGMIIHVDKLLIDKNNIIVGFMFYYFVLIYASLFRRQINYYYYYGRYLVPYIPFVILEGVLMIKQIKKYGIRLACVISSALIAFTMAAIYDTVLISEKDDTRLSWQGLKACSEMFDDNDIVIVEQNVAPILYLPLMHMTDSDVYMQYDVTLDKQLADLLKKSEDKDIYFISNEYYGKSQWESVYIGNYTKSEDDNKTEHLIPFPKEMKKEECQVYIYRYYSEQTEYMLRDTELLTNGFYSIEGESRWTNGRGTIYCFLEPAEYEVHLQQGSYLPLVELGKESIIINLYLNGELADEYILTLENRQEDIVFHVTNEQLRQGRNELLIESEQWCPANLGKGDVRQLGISIRAIEFLKPEY